MPETSGHLICQPAHGDALPREFEIDHGDALPGEFETDHLMYLMQGVLETVTTELPQDQAITVVNNSICNNRDDPASLPPSLSTLWPEATRNPALDIAHRDEDACLLMHYVDQVFYIQFPFYDCTAIYGDRGWLLCLFT